MTLKNTKIFLYQKERKKLNKSLNELKKVLNLKKFVVKLIVLIMKTSIFIIIIIILPMTMNIEKFGVLENYLKSLIEIITNQ